MPVRLPRQSRICHFCYLCIYLFFLSWPLINVILHHAVSVSCSLEVVHEQIDEETIDKVLMVEGVMMNWEPLQQVLCAFYQLTLNFPSNASCLLSSGTWIGCRLLPIKASEVIYFLITG